MVLCFGSVTRRVLIYDYLVTVEQCLHSIKTTSASRTVQPTNRLAWAGGWEETQKWTDVIFLSKDVLWSAPDVISFSNSMKKRVHAQVVSKERE